MSRICSLGPNRNDLFRFGNELKRFGLFLIRYLNVCGTFVERLWNVCSFTVLILLPRMGYLKLRKDGGYSSQPAVNQELLADMADG